MPPCLACTSFLRHTRCAQAALGLVWVVVLAGCATPVLNTPINEPPLQTPAEAAPSDIVGENLIALSFSGGGLRAAAFSLGVLEGLIGHGPAQADVLDDATFITSVSGGSLTAAYFGLHGREGLVPLRKEVLVSDMELKMRLSAWSVENWLRLMTNGGVNDRATLGQWLDEKVFKGATFADLYRRKKPDIWINATDLYNRTPFPFIPPVFSALCSELSTLPIAEAVYASMAVPLVFAPVVLKTYPDKCTQPLDAFVAKAVNDPQSPRILAASAQAVQNYRNPDVMRYVKLVDGGLTDNNGLSSLLISRTSSGTPYGPFTQGDVVRMRQMLFVVADAGRTPSGDWALQSEGPSGLDIALIAADIATDAAARLSFDTFTRMIHQWRDDIIAYRCSLSTAVVKTFLGDRLARWRCDDVHFEVTLLSFDDLGPQRALRLNAIPTRLTLPARDIDDAIQAGTDALHSNPAFARYLQSRRPTQR